VRDELADRGERPEAINEKRSEYARDLLLALDEDIRPPSITTDGARSILQRLSEAAEIDIGHPKHDYLAPHGGRRGMGKSLSGRSDIRLQPGISITRRKWFVNGIRILRPVNWAMSQRKHSTRLIL